MQRVALLGGSGFIGRALSAQLLRGGHEVRVVTRNAAAARARLGTRGDTKSEYHECDVVNDSRDSVSRAIDGCDGVVNLIGLLYESSGAGRNFAAAHVGLADTLSGVLDGRRCVQISALGASAKSASAYARTKGEAESLLNQDAVILRPSIVYGPEDSFFNRFAQMAKYSPFLPAVGGGVTKYQPVHVEDLAAAICKALQQDKDTGIYQLGGADTLTFAQLMRMVLSVTGRCGSRLVLPIPYPVATVQGAVFEALHRLVPSIPPIITRDQVELLKHHNVVEEDAAGFGRLGIRQRGCTEVDIQYIRNV